MSKKLVEGEEYYYNEAGYVVLTEKYHLEKGYCCGNGCLHCPYDYDAVPEPRRTQMLLLKHENKSKYSQENPVQKRGYEA